MQFVSRSLGRVKKALFGPRTATPESQPTPAPPPTRPTSPAPMPHPVSDAEQTRLRLPRIPVGWTIPLMRGTDPAPPYIPPFAPARAGAGR